MTRSYDTHALLALFGEVARTLSHGSLQHVDGREQQWEVELMPDHDTLLMARGSYYGDTGPAPAPYNRDSLPDDPERNCSCDVWGIWEVDEDSNEHKLPLTREMRCTLEDMIIAACG